MKRVLFLVTVSAGLAQLMAEDAKPPTPAITRENAFTFYSAYKRMTPKPYQVSQAIATLCTSSPAKIAAATEAAAKVHGPHAEALIHVYASEAAARKLDQASSTPYSEGSVIVKEKLGEGKAVTAIGGMIKRAKGYDPEHSDWEYFYAEKGGEVTTGRMSNCIQCHSSAKAQDYVFGKWQPQSPLR